MVDLAHQVLGPKDGKAVLLVHGFPLDRGMWRFQANALASAGLRVVIPDLAGFGQSEGASHTTMEGHARDLVALLDRLRVPKATVVGFSMGGYVALAFAHLAPSRLEGLVLVDTRAEADAADAKGRRDAAIVEVLGHGVRPLATKQIPGQLTEATRASQRLLVEEVRGIMLRQPKAAVVAALQAMRDRADLRETLRGLTVPCLVLVGEKDGVTPLAAAQVMADLSRGELQVIDGAAHLTPMEKPHDVNAALIDWFASP